MICPRCKTENGSRTICSKCGFYIYHPDVNNRVKMTKAERAREDAKIMGKKVWKVLKVVWIIIVIVVMSFWILAGLMYLSGGIGLG
ncbi:MAG: hypothetical protein IKT14_03445 [Clostridiales bacterium]|nr:hypothetical protein [Clostridiales bacterium]MBR6484052.1 hypothetical protein [Clostridiales bacterium]